MLSPSATIRGRDGVLDGCAGARASAGAGACVRAGAGFAPHAAARSNAQATITGWLCMLRELAFELGDRLFEHAAMRGRGRRGELAARSSERHLYGLTPRRHVTFLRSQGAGDRPWTAIGLGLLKFNVFALESSCHN